jgi:PAS domain S-box-containing protein
MVDLFSGNVEIADLDLANRLLGESRAGFLKIFHGSPVCMSMTTLENRKYVQVNQKFIEKFGFPKSDIIGRTSLEVGILDAEESARVGALIREKGRLHNDYVKCIDKDGKFVHTVSSIEKMEMSGEIYLVSFFLDITKIMDQQTVIERHLQQLEAVNKELEAFSYSVSHDLRAPLRAIDGYTKILEEDFNAILNDEGKKILSAVQRNAQKMGNLIEDLLSFAKLGEATVQKTNIDMSQLVHETLTDLQKTTNHRAELHVGTLHMAKGNYALIKQVIVNLISNAVKYSSKKEHPVVTISSERKDNQVIYTIRDNGEGFDMKYVDRLFGIFQRLHSDKEFEGTGVGLSIVQRILHKHGGTIRAQAELGQGATFVFVLPAEP